MSSPGAPEEGPRPGEFGTMLHAGSTIQEHITLGEIEQEWRGLWREADDASVFQSPEWLIPWWRHLGGENLRLVAIRSAGRLLSLLPLYVYVDASGGWSQLTLLGNGISDQLGILVRQEAVREALAAVREIAATEPRLDACDFRDLPAHSALLEAVPPPSFEREVIPESPCPVLALPKKPEGLEGVVPGRLLKKLDYALGRAAREGEVRFRTATTETVESDMSTLLRLHRARWGERGSAGGAVNEREEHFHAEAAARLAAAGLLRLHVLTIGGREAAVFYGFHAHGRTSYYLGGFDPSRKIVSPGSLVLRHAIEVAIADGATEFDFLRGSEPYKYAWGAVDRPQFRVRWIRRDGAPPAQPDRQQR